MSSSDKSKWPMFLTHIEDYPNELKLKYFEFFYWFSRFEFALKENRYIRKGPSNAALPDWHKFRDRFSGAYKPSRESALLMSAPPERQVFADGSYKWKKVDLEKESADLGKVILILKTIRNNLFHGGKSSEKDWDNPDRNIFLLENGKKVLDSLARLGDLEPDYRRYY
jgi:hypothetical protein